MLDFTRFKALTFDCYGTFIDWEAGILKSLKMLFKSKNVSISDAEILESYAKFEHDLEHGEFKIYSKILNGVVRKFAEKYNFEVSEREADVLSKNFHLWVPFSDTGSAIRSLKRHYKMGPLTNIENKLFDISACLLEEELDWVLTAEDIGSYKPSLSNFEYMLKYLNDNYGIKKNQIIHVAQSKFHDIVPAKAMGITNIWVNRKSVKPGTGVALSAQVKPDLEVPDLKTLARVVSGSFLAEV